MLSLIILSYNDARSLEENLPDWINVLDSLGHPYEIIVADDGSTDDTAQVVKSIGKSNVRHVRNECNKGVGANFRLGITHACGDLVAYTDGDGQYLPDDLRLMLNNLKTFDMVTGRRIHRADPFVRTITSNIYNRLVKIVYPVCVRDVNSGLKIFRRTYIDNCIPQVSDGPFYDAEYLIKGQARGMKINEIPIGHRPRKYGRQAGVSLKSIRFLLRELAKDDMAPFTRRNYFSKLIFKFFAIAPRLFSSNS